MEEEEEKEGHVEGLSDELSDAEEITISRGRVSPGEAPTTPREAPASPRKDPASDSEDSSASSHSSRSRYSSSFEDDSGSEAGDRAKSPPLPMDGEQDVSAESGAVKDAKVAGDRDRASSHGDKEWAEASEGNDAIKPGYSDISPREQAQNKAKFAPDTKRTVELGPAQGPRHVPTPERLVERPRSPLPKSAPDSKRVHEEPEPSERFSVPISSVVESSTPSEDMTTTTQKDFRSTGKPASHKVGSLAPSKVRNDAQTSAYESMTTDSNFRSTQMTESTTAKKEAQGLQESADDSITANRTVGDSLDEENDSLIASHLVSDVQGSSQKAKMARRVKRGQPGGGEGHLQTSSTDGEVQESTEESSFARRAVGETMVSVEESLVASRAVRETLESMEDSMARQQTMQSEEEEVETETEAERTSPREEESATADSAGESDMDGGQEESLRRPGTAPPQELEGSILKELEQSSAEEVSLNNIRLGASKGGGQVEEELRRERTRSVQVLDSSLSTVQPAGGGGKERHKREHRMCDSEDSRLRGVEEMCQWIVSKANIQSLTLRNVALTDELFKRLTDALLSTLSLPRVLNLSGNQLTAQSVGGILEVLRKISCLDVLVLQGNRLGDEGVVQLAEGLLGLHTEDQTQKKRELKEQRIIDSDEEGEVNVASVQGFKFSSSFLSLRELDLSDLSLTDGATLALGQLLESDFGLCCLSLASNPQISLEGWTRIGMALKRNTRLTTLSLGHNNLGDEGVEVIARALKHSENVHHVDLENNGIGMGGGKALHKLVRDNPNVLELTLSPGNSIPASYEEEIRKMLARNRKEHDMQ